MVDPERIIQAELSPEERLLWVGSARTGLILRPVDAFLIPFALMWCGMVGHGLATTLAEGGPGMWGSAAFFSAFLLVGMFVVVGRFVLDAWLRRRMCFGVSNERVVIVSGLMRHVVRSINLDTVTDIVVTEHSDGSGSIAFGPLKHWHGGWQAMNDWAGAAMYYAPLLELAGDVRRVHQIILDVRRELREKAR